MSDIIQIYGSFVSIMLLMHKIKIIKIAKAANHIDSHYQNIFKWSKRGLPLFWSSGKCQCYFEVFVTRIIIIIIKYLWCIWKKESDILPTFRLEISKNRGVFPHIKIHGTSEFYPWSPWEIHWQKRFSLEEMAPRLKVDSWLSSTSWGSWFESKIQEPWVACRPF